MSIHKIRSRIRVLVQKLLVYSVLVSLGLCLILSSHKCLSSDNSAISAKLYDI